MLEYLPEERVGAFDAKLQPIVFPRASGGFPEQVLGDVDERAVQIRFQDTDRIDFARSMPCRDPHKAGVHFVGWPKGGWG